jgi:predicted HAD superfamily phosphohydrolase
VANLLFLDMEGPLSIQDNACEMMNMFPDGGRIFDLVKRYDRLLSLDGRDDYDPGDGLVRIVPFLVHHGVTADDMVSLADRAAIVDGADELIAGLTGWEVFCVTASYEQYAARIVQRVGIDLKRLACTRFPIERCYELITDADRNLIQDVEREILGLGPDDDKKLRERLGLYYDVELPQTPFGSTVQAMRAMGGRKKAAALRNFARVRGQFPDQVVVVGDSVTDCRMLEAVDREGGLALAFNATEDAIYYATVGVASTSIGDIRVLLDAWGEGGRDAVVRAISERRVGRFQWLADNRDLDEPLRLHLEHRRLVRQSAGLD